MFTPVVKDAFCFRIQSAVHIISTSLESLNLQSLTEVTNGGIIIIQNSQLCFAETINWRSMAKSKDARVLVTRNKNATECGK